MLPLTTRTPMVGEDYVSGRAAEAFSIELQEEEILIGARWQYSLGGGWGWGWLWFFRNSSISVVVFRNVRTMLIAVPIPPIPPYWSENSEYSCRVTGMRLCKDYWVRFGSRHPTRGMRTSLGRNETYFNVRVENFDISIISAMEPKYPNSQNFFVGTIVVARDKIGRNYSIRIRKRPI